MRTIIVTGSAGLIGSETVRRFAKEGARVVGIDNDMRARFFGKEASTKKHVTI
jgi:CDP-paratose 2-epimerase